MRINLKKLVALGALALIPCVAQADDNAEAAKAAQPEARAMLGSPANGGSIEKKVGPNDFVWSALTQNGPASGNSPVIGAGSGKAYYDFKDGLPHPYYIQGKK